MLLLLLHVRIRIRAELQQLPKPVEEMLPTGLSRPWHELLKGAGPLIYIMLLQLKLQLRRSDREEHSPMPMSLAAVHRVSLLELVLLVSVQEWRRWLAAPVPIIRIHGRIHNIIATEYPLEWRQEQRREYEVVVLVVPRTSMGIHAHGPNQPCRHPKLLHVAHPKQPQIMFKNSDKYSNKSTSKNK
jgi:hypothetical protein